MAGGYRNYSKKTGMKKTKKQKSFTKEVRKEIKNISYKTQETKQINVPDFTTPTTNTIAEPYLNGGGIKYLFVDGFKVARGTDDGTQIGAANRIGNSIYALGIRMNYAFSARTLTTSPTNLILPFVRLRIIVFQANSSVAPPPATATLIDTNFCGTGAFNPSTLAPIKYNGGFVKRVLYDKVKVIKNNYNSFVPGNAYPETAVYTFNKYIKLNQRVKYSTLVGEPTEEPIHMCICAEVDNSLPLIASTEQILTITGYSQCFYKDG